MLVKIKDAYERNIFVNPYNVAMIDVEARTIIISGVTGNNNGVIHTDEDSIKELIGCMDLM